MKNTDLVFNNYIFYYDIWGMNKLYFISSSYTHTHTHIYIYIYNLGEDCYSGIYFWLGLNYYHRNCFFFVKSLFFFNKLPPEDDLCKLNRKLGLKNNSGGNNLNLHIELYNIYIILYMNGSVSTEHWNLLNRIIKEQVQ